MGVCFVIENITIDYSQDDDDSQLEGKASSLTCGSGGTTAIQDPGKSNYARIK